MKKLFIFGPIGLIVCIVMSAGMAHAAACTLSPPICGTWVIDRDCECGNTITKQITLFNNVSVQVQDGAVLTIKDGFDFKMNFNDQKLVVKDGSGVLIKQGGKLRQKP